MHSHDVYLNAQSCEVFTLRDPSWMVVGVVAKSQDVVQASAMWAC